MDEAVRINRRWWDYVRRMEEDRLPRRIMDSAMQPPAERRGSGSRSLQGWSPWSEWSTCSRSCDGGASYQLRRCNSPTGCDGESVRYKICNMQPCPEEGDFRLQQCAAFNSVPYEGQLLSWTPHHEESEPCALTCRGRPRWETPSEDSEEALIVVQLAPKVQDGTRCRPGSLDMCINGKCQRVGCDLRIGSYKKVDSCGVCGGDGSSCAQPLYHWEETPLSLCSATCGGGRRMSRAVCKNRLTGAEVEEQLCNASQKPDRKVTECNTQPCPPRWVTDEWGPCSVSCGGGSRFRHVFCAEDDNGTRNKVQEHLCRGHKPHYQEPCNLMDCPSWNTGEWSGCSVSCGEGVQTRSVSCRDARDAPSLLCDATIKPAHLQPCRTGIPCPDYSSSFYDSGGDVIERLPGVDHTQPLVQPYPPPAPGTYIGTAERLVGGKQVVPSESTFIPENWSPCSVTCGVGVRTRVVHCKIFLEFSRTIAKLPDAQCQGPKPPATEQCEMDPCVNDKYETLYGDSIKVGGGGLAGKTYSWKEMGFTHCSASCLGGVQESLITCVRDNDGKAVSPYLCAKETRPEVLIRTCNDHPCPPRWNYSDFQACSKSCGIGIQTRDVTCIHEVTRGGSNTVIVPNNMCPQPPPPDRQYCNVLDCPIKWHTSEWSKCSRPCGGGIKTRQVECQQVMAQNHIVSRPASKCPPVRPPDKKPCNTKPCAMESDRPHIAVSNTTYKQQSPNKKRVTLKIGGQAVVYVGTQIKIKCPVKKFNRTKILWEKNNTQIVNSKKYRISKKGALRIQDVNYADNGKYTCIAGQSRADLYLSVKQRLGVLTSSEEIERQHTNRVPERHGMDDANMDIASANYDVQSPFLQPGDDFSHEHRPLDGNPRKLIPKKQPGERSRIRPTPPPLLPPPDAKEEVNVNHLETWHSTTHVSDQEQEPLAPSHMPVLGTSGPDSVLPPRLPDPLEDPPSSSVSGSTRPMPHFQQLLANLQTFSNSRGHRMVTEAMEEEHTHDEDDDGLDDDGLGPIVVLGKGSPENLRFTWMISNWSDCSQTCGGNGIQTRAAHCMVQLHNNTQHVDKNLCDDAGLSPPLTIQKCGLDDCPQWVASSWSSCEDSRCFTWNTAMQRREVSCQLSNGTSIESHHCSEAEKPPQRQECYNDKCKGTWKVGEWSECAAPCEQPGIKYRILQCVWYGTKKPAGNACRDQTRPVVMKVCKGPPCALLSGCKDQSKYCHNVRAMNMCRVRRYQYQCCQSCRYKG
ncbi:protein madd-4 [Anabrus simplex]|uniref:protein madd-4 n=1 Tax=Anabrus simplex TaxID=316456 RepID=UPI0035A389E6